MSKEFVDALAKGDNVSAQDAFKTAMLQKVGDELEKNRVEVAKTFVFSLVPIALAYNLSHYFSFLIITGQNIIPLISDPFGFNWNMFGTKNYIPNFSIINARFVWILSVFSLVVGHIISVYISHKIASRSISSNKLVIQTQIPMLFLMVFYTAISLWIIAQPIVE